MEGSHEERANKVMQVALDRGYIEQDGPSDTLDVTPITEDGMDMLGLLAVAMAEKYGYRETARFLTSYLRDAQAACALRRLFKDILRLPVSLVFVDLDDAREDEKMSRDDEH